MSKTKILTKQKAREKLKAGIDQLTDIIKETLGPKGRNVVLKRMGPITPRIVNDGVTIAREINLNDPFERCGAELVKEVCERTNEMAGDGTTTSAILVQALVDEGYKLLATGINPMEIKREFQEGLKEAVEALKKLTFPVKTNKEVKAVASIAANNDDEIGGKIAEIIDKVGKEATITVEKSNKSEIEVEIVKGMYFEKGYVSPYFAAGFEKGKIVYEDVHILLTDKNLEYIEDFLPLFKKIEEENQKGTENITRLLIIAREVNGEALATFIQNYVLSLQKLNEGFKNVCVEAPDVGYDQKEILNDIATMVGAKVISDQTGISFKSADISILGKASKVIVDKNKTIIVGGKGDKEKLDERIDSLRAEIEQTNPSDKIILEKLKKRLGKITSGVGVIKAGGPTEVETKDKHLRIEDAILATQAALEDGISAGGGYTFLQLSEIVKSPIIKQACRSIATQVARNAGLNGEIVVNKCLLEKVGYNAKTNEYGDLMKMGVIDATKVIRTSLENAISLASLFLTTEAVITEVPEDLKPRSNFINRQQQ